MNAEARETLRRLADSTWKPVVGYEQSYEVSDQGLVRRVSGELVGQWANDQGYMLVRLSGPRRTVRVHRLVAEAFVSNPSGAQGVNHIDCNRANNAAANLEWCSQGENIRHSRRLGRYPDYWKGKRSPNATLSPDVVDAIRSAYATGAESWDSIAKRFGTNKRTVGKIVRMESYV